MVQLASQERPVLLSRIWPNLPFIMEMDQHFKAGFATYLMLQLVHQEVLSLDSREIIQRVAKKPQNVFTR